MYKSGRKGAHNELVASIIFIGTLVIFNIAIFINISEYYTQYNVFKNISKISVLFFILFIYLLLYKYLGSKKRVFEIFKEFGKLSNKQKSLLNILSILYIAVTLVLLFFTL